MSAATICFVDIVNFSKKPTAEQLRLINSLTAEVVHDLRPLLNPPMANPSILALPTGDGMAIAFLHRPSQPWDRATILTLILKIQRWAGAQTLEHGQVSLRVGIHVGPVELLTDINGKPNVCGDTINFAQRVMDAANPRQVLFSEAAFREYVGTESPFAVTPPFSEQMKACFIGPIEVHAKHGLQVLVYKLTLEPAESWWCNEDPDAAKIMLVHLTPLPKRILGTFSQNFENASQVALIQLTGERFLNSFRREEIRFSKKLRRFWVFMPESESYSDPRIWTTPERATKIREFTQQWKELFAQLKGKYPKADLKLGLFYEPPFLGASYMDWDRPKGRIHISPYVWGVDTPDCPGYELLWIGRKPSAIYEVYVEGLRYLHSTTENIAFSKP